MDTSQAPRVAGAGLGLRRALLTELERDGDAGIDFLEVAPENWMPMGGRFGRRFREVTEGRTLVAHGLSLSIGGPAPLDQRFLRDLRGFLDEHGIADYTEHLSACGDDGQLYDLMPLPFTEDAVHWVAERVRIVQDVLDRRLALENVSYYAAPGAELTELEFLCAVLEEADCDLLLDVNNVEVNATNHGYDARAFLEALPGERIRYLHVAGHSDRAPDLKIDTHGAPVPAPVWDHLALTYDRHGVLPTVLERDFDIPPLATLVGELGEVRRLQARALADGARVRHVA